MGVQRFTVNGPQAVPVIREGDETATVKVTAGSTIRYGYTPKVTTSSYAGSITSGNELEFTRNVWIVSVDKSEVQVTIEDTVQGTPLDSVVSDSEATDRQVPWLDPDTGRFSWRDPDVLSVKQFGATGDGTTNDTAAVQAAVDYAVANPDKYKVVYFPAGNYSITHIENLNHVSLKGEAPSRAIALLGGLTLLSNLGSRIIQRSGATQPLINPIVQDEDGATLGGNLGYGWQEIENLTLQGNFEANISTPKRPITAVADRHHFTVATGHLPAQPSNYTSFPYYGVCAFFDSNGVNLGTGIVQSVNAGTGQVTLLSGTDNYGTRQGTSDLLTTAETVAFAPRATYDADGYTNTNVSDSTMLSPPAIYTQSRTVRIKNVYIRDFWCGVVIGDSVCNIQNIWTNNCRMAGLALRSLYSGADVSGAKWYFQGGYWSPMTVDGTTYPPEIAREDAGAEMSLCGMWGLTTAMHCDELTTNNCYHGVIEGGNGSGASFGYVFLDIPFKEAWWTVNGIGGNFDPTVTIGKFAARSNGLYVAMPGPAVTSFPTGQRSAIAIQGTSPRKIVIGSFSAFRCPDSISQDDFTYGTYIANDPSTGEHDVHIGTSGSLNAVSTSLSGGVRPAKAPAPFGSHGVIATQFNSKRVMYGANDTGLVGITDDANKTGLLGMAAYDWDRFFNTIFSSASSSAHYLGLGGGAGSERAATLVGINTAADVSTNAGVIRVLTTETGGTSMRKDGTAASAHAASAILDLQGTDGGFLAPRVTTAQRNAISSPATGLVVFNTDTARNEVYQGTAWVPFAYDPAQAQNGMWCSPNSSYTVSTTVASANTARFARFIPRRKLTVVKIGFVTTNPATNDDAVDVGIYDATGAKLVSSGATTGKANATAGAQTVSVASTVLNPGVVYYAALAYGAVGGTAATIQTLTAGAAGTVQMFGATAGLLDSGTQSGATLGSTLSFASPSSTGFNLAVLES